jgi:hypothetical protein
VSSSYSIEIIYISHAKTEHTLFVPLWPLVWKGLWIESTKSILPFILCQASLCSNFWRLDYIEQKLLHRNHCLQMDHTKTDHSI